MISPSSHRRSATQTQIAAAPSKVSRDDDDPHNSDKENGNSEDNSWSLKMAKKEFSLGDLRKSFNRQNLSLDPLMRMHFEEVGRLESAVEDDPVDLGPLESSESPKRVIRSTTRLHSTRDSRGNKYLNQYIIIKDLGKGTYGKVKLCLNTQDRQLYAIKVIDKVLLKRRSIGRSSQVLQGVMREIAILKKMNHPNIVALHEVIDDHSHNKLYMVLEYVQGGPIVPFSSDQVAPPLAESVAWVYFRDICMGLDYLHYHKVIHRDLKPENLLRATDGTVKISDFGVSDVFDKTDTTTRTAGTPAFLAPEACSMGQFRGRDVDIWALGVCLFVMVFGCIPFQAASKHEMYDRIRNDPLVFPDTPEVTDEVKDLLRAILTKDPEQRISLPMVMVHPWVTRGGHIPLLSLIVQMHGDSPVSLQVSDYEVSHAFADAGLMHLFDPVFTERTYEPGDYIIRQGEEGEDMFFINSGECEIVLQRSLHADDDFDARQYLASAPPSKSVSSVSHPELRGSVKSNRGRWSRQSEPIMGDEASGDETPMQTTEAPPKRGPGESQAQGAAEQPEEEAREDIFKQRVARFSIGSGEGYMTEEKVIARRLPGQFVGEMAMFGGSSSPTVRSASVRARTPTTVLVVNKAEVSKILANNKGAEDVIRNEIERRHRETTDALAWARVSSASINRAGSPSSSLRPSNDGSTSPNLPASPHSSTPPSALGFSRHPWNDVESIVEGSEDELAEREDKFEAAAKEGGPPGGSRRVPPIKLASSSSLTSEDLMTSSEHLFGGRGAGTSVPGTPTGFNAMAWEKLPSSGTEIGKETHEAGQLGVIASAAPTPILKRDISLSPQMKATEQDDDD